MRMLKLGMKWWLLLTMYEGQVSFFSSGNPKFYLLDVLIFSKTQIRFSASWVLSSLSFKLKLMNLLQLVYL